MCCEKLNQKVKNLSLCDISCIKLSAALFGLVVAKGIDLIWHWNLLAHVSIWWFLILGVLVALKPLIKFWSKKENQPTAGA